MRDLIPSGRSMRSAAGGLSLALGALAGVVVGAATTPVAGEAQAVRIIQRERLPGDSLAELVLTANVVDVKRMVMQWRERESQIVRELRVTQDTDVVSRRRLAEELAKLTRDGFALMSAIEARCLDEATPKPDGYLGVNVEQRFEVSGGGVGKGTTSLTSVEPGSPAQAAGLRPGDRLLAIGGRDARERLPELGDLLIPGRTVVVRVEREGRPLDLSVAIRRRPEGFGRSCGEFDAMLEPLRMAAPGRIFVERFQGGDPQRQAVETRSGALPRRAEPPEMNFFVFTPGTDLVNTRGFFAGAEFRPLDDDWREVLGVKQGVIVNEVANGSSAALAGLRGGDVITAVDRSPVSSPLGLVQLLGMNERSEATLTVVRKKEQKTITLRWGPR